MDSLLNEALIEIRRATNGMTLKQLAWHPEGKWSTAEILEHLTLTFVGTAKGMQRVAQSGVNGSGKATFQQRVGVWVVTRLGYFPSGRKSPEMVEPKSCEPATAVARIVEALTNMGGVLRDVENRFGSKAKIPHPILGPLTVKQWKKFHSVHTRHHMKQVDRLRKLAS
jgi:Protein of unknown function (DUF1569)